MTTIPPPKFEDLMKRYHGEIERLVYAAEIHCQGKDRKGTPSCPFYSCPFNDPWNMLCRIERIRLVMGEHQPVGDPAPYCIPCERTIPECGACKGPAPHPHWCDTCGQPHDDHLCEANGRKVRLAESDKELVAAVGCGSWKGPATKQCEDCLLNGLRLCMYHGYPEDTIPPICDYRIVDIDRDEYCIQQLRNKQQPALKCPKCGGATFRANIDDQDMILCYNDACKWKGPAEIGGCPHGERIGGMIRCVLAGSCPYQKPNAINDGSCWYVCTREVAALAACEQYQQEIKQRDGS